VELELAIETKDSGAVTVERLPFAGRLVLGRGPESPVALDGPLISREHVAFEYQGGKLSLEDLSANGSWLNGQPLVRGRRYEVTEADRVQLPGYEMRCVILQREGAVAAEASTPVAIPQVSPLKGVMNSITGMEIVVALSVLAAVALSVIFLRM
jgi:pSer/pThr/pTyr-binding forkhead associated (FHA) protein